jgi:uncharacterized membrane protein
LIVASIVLVIFDWNNIQTIKDRLDEVVWMGISLLVTEALFIVGAVLMAVSAGESLSDFKRLHHWPRKLNEFKKNARQFAERLIVSRLFTIGFWINFAGAVGTSVILIVAVVKFAPYTGIGVLTIIAIDLITTFGWRIPLELARRRVQKHGVN